MLHRKKIAVCSEIHTEHINKMCGQNAEFLIVKGSGTVHIVTTGLYNIKSVVLQDINAVDRLIFIVSSFLRFFY